MLMAESRLQWSSDSTLGASPTPLTTTENGKRMLKYHQVLNYRLIGHAMACCGMAWVKI